MTDNTTKTTYEPSKERELTAEANVIKAALTQEKSNESPKEKIDFYFTALGASIYPGLTPVKIAGSILTGYVPDFYYVSEMINLSFEFIRNDKSVKKDDDLDPYGYMLYCHYCMMYQVIKIINELGNANAEMQWIQTAFENAGITSACLPIFLNYWFDGLGHYIDPIFERKFEVVLPDISSSGSAYDNYFWSPNVAHLLPNFRSVMAKALFFSKDSSSNVVPALKTISNYRNSAAAATPAYLANVQLTREYDYRIPGQARLTRPHVSDEFARIIAETITIAQPTNIGRYFQFNPGMIRYLVNSYHPLVKRMSHFNLSSFSTIGNDLLTCILIESPDQEVIDPEIDIEADPNSVPPVLSRKTAAGYNYKARVFTKTKTVNGSATTCSVSPIVRLSADSSRILFTGHTYVEPNHVWYHNNHEFRTNELTLAEAMSGFRKLHA